MKRYTVAEASRRLERDESYVRNSIALGKLSVVPTVEGERGRIRILAEDLEAFEIAHRREVRPERWRRVAVLDRRIDQGIDFILQVRNALEIARLRPYPAGNIVDALGIAEPGDLPIIVVIGELTVVDHNVLSALVPLHGRIEVVMVLGHELGSMVRQCWKLVGERYDEAQGRG